MVSVEADVVSSCASANQDVNIECSRTSKCQHARTDASGPSGYAAFARWSSRTWLPHSTAIAKSLSTGLTS